MDDADEDVPTSLYFRNRCVSLCNFRTMKRKAQLLGRRRQYDEFLHSVRAKISVDIEAKHRANSDVATSQRPLGSNPIPAKTR